MSLHGDDPKLYYWGSGRFLMLCPIPLSESPGDKLAGFQVSVYKGLLKNPAYVSATVSIGAATDRELENDFYEVILKAEAALQHAKNCGGNQCSTYDSTLHNDILHPAQLREKLVTAIKSREFQMYYQPIVDAGRGSFQGFEALIRWNRPDDDPVFPSTIIRTAEESGCMKQLERWILEEVFSQIRKWLDAGFPVSFVSINLSPKGLVESDLDVYIKKLSAMYQINPEKVILEGTETALLSDVDASIEMMNKLIRIGYKFALDDFGTGYSSLIYLKQFRPQLIKLSKEFIRDIDFNQGTQILIGKILELVHGLGLQSVIEGVERKAQLNILENLHVDYFQGYYFGRPMPADKVEAWLSVKH